MEKVSGFERFFAKCRKGCIVVNNATYRVRRRVCTRAPETAGSVSVVLVIRTLSSSFTTGF